MTSLQPGSVKEQISAAVTPRLARWMRVHEAKSMGDEGCSIATSRYAPRIGSPGNSQAYSLLQFSADQLAEFERTEADIERLPRDEAFAVRATWLWVGTDNTRAADIRALLGLKQFSVFSLYRAKDRAYERLYFTWFG